ncbi:MAG: imidazolonepropionase [Candidatus Limnocylindrales bacterium]
MSRRAIIGRGRLLTMSGASTGATGAIEGAWVLVLQDGRVLEVRAGRLQPGDPDEVEDVGTALVTPGLVDSHTHLIFAGDRSDEAAARTRGERYTGGGILRTVAATVAAGDDELVRDTRLRLLAARAQGTTTIEVKSGYGLEPAQEHRLLRLIGRAAEGLAVRVRRTHLGAHAIPAGSDPETQHEAIIGTLPELAAEADHIDVFCEPRIFDLRWTRAIAEAGAANGLPLKLHADQLERSGGAVLGVELGALSVDHLEHITAADAAVLAGSSTAATILPGPALMLRAGTPPVRALIDAGATVAVASDANAGTFGESSMPLAIGLATMLGFTIDEALWAATAGGAGALGLDGEIGRVLPGAAADLVAWDAEHEGAFAHRLGGVRPAWTWFGGETDD